MGPAEVRLEQENGEQLMRIQNSRMHDGCFASCHGPWSINEVLMETTDIRIVARQGRSYAATNLKEKAKRVSQIPVLSLPCLPSLISRHVRILDQYEASIAPMNFISPFHPKAGYPRGWQPLQSVGRQIATRLGNTGIACCRHHT